MYITDNQVRQAVALLNSGRCASYGTSGRVTDDGSLQQITTSIEDTEHTYLIAAVRSTDTQSVGWDGWYAARAGVPLVIGFQKKIRQEDQLIVVLAGEWVLMWGDHNGPRHRYKESQTVRVVE